MSYSQGIACGYRPKKGRSCNNRTGAGCAAVVTIDPWTITAHHECGHCVGYLHFRWRFNSVRIWQDRDGQVFGSVLSPAGNYDDVKRAIICMAGPVAEEKLTGVAPEDQADSAVDIAMAREALAPRQGFCRRLDFAVHAIACRTGTAGA
jgi:hypothetical protein